MFNDGLTSIRWVTDVQINIAQCENVKCEAFTVTGPKQLSRLNVLNRW